MNMTAVLGLWLVLPAATIALAIYRKVLANSEDNFIHLTHGGGGVVESQAAMAAKLAAIDKWGKTLTIVSVVTGLMIGSVYVYEALRAVPV